MNQKNTESKINEIKTTESNLNFETKCGVMIAVFAACMAVSDLFAGKFGDDEIVGTNEKSSAYMWYQSKSIKENLVESQVDLLKSMVATGAIQANSLKAVQSQIETLSQKARRYSQEKNEILLGSQSVGVENWIQDVGGEFGKIIGAKEIEASLSMLSRAGDKFDLASLFYQLCLVMGAIGLVVKQPALQQKFLTVMVALGSIGIGFTTWAFSIVF